MFALELFTQVPTRLQLVAFQVIELSLILNKPDACLFDSEQMEFFA